MAAVDGAGTQAQYFTDLRFAVLKEIIEQNDVPLLRRQPQDGLGQHGVVDLNRPAVDVQRAAGTVFLFAGIRFSGYVEPFQRDLPCLTSCSRQREKLPISLFVSHREIYFSANNSVSTLFISASMQIDCFSISMGQMASP